MGNDKTVEWTPKVVNLIDHKPFGKRWLSHGPERETEGIMLHATAGSSASGAISALRAKNFSYDVIIDNDGTIYKCVPFNHKTSHAGKSVGWSGPNCNRYTLGIAFVNLNDGEDTLSPQQELAVRWYIKAQIKPALPGVRKLTTHYGASFPRKNDPRTVNARAIAEDCGLEYWPGLRKD